MQLDLTPAPALKNKLRRDWGTKNTIGLKPKQNASEVKNAFAQQRVRHKIATFCQRAIFPQQLTVPRQYATTREGVWIYKYLEGREIDGYREPGVRVVVQENTKNARFIMSPLFDSKTDAIGWAVAHTGVTI